ncbi:MAG TPA: hypothetical protein PK878_01795 [bacterium]|nr:hypothetical protein [bacterium]
MRTSTWLKILCMILIPLLLTTGCAKRDAQKAIAQAQAAKDEAQRAQAPGYAPRQFEDANRMFNQAQQQFDAGEYKQAIESAVQAEGRFKNSISVAAEVKPRVEAIIRQIEDALAKATGNVDKARSANVLTPEEINPVASEVDGLRQRLETEVRNMVDEEQLNAFLTEVEQTVAHTETLALAYLKPQANTAKEEVDALIARAQEMKADIFLPERFNQVMQQYGQLEAGEQEGNWQAVIDLAGQMKDPLNQIIQASQEKAAGEILRETAQRIAQAKQLNLQNVPAYSSAIEMAETSLQSGQTALQNQDYAGAINAADAAKASLQQAYQAVGQEAQRLIESAKANLQSAIDQEAEKYAPSVISQVREGIEGSEDLLKAQNFAMAYQAAQRAFQASADAQDAGHRGRAQLALDAAEKPFSILYSQGGSQYAPEAYSQAQAAIQDLRNKLKNKEYDAVVEGSPAAAQIAQKALQALAQAAREHIQKAEKALEEARQANAPDWVGMQFANAVNLRSAAEKNLLTERYLDSIRNSEAAVKTAGDAQARAYQLQTEQNLRRADEFLAQAKRAEQDRLSPLAYRQAVQTREATIRLIEQRQYREGYESSLVALQKAEQALNNLVLTARAQTDSALAAQAMEYSPEDLQKALALLTQAEEAQAARNYPTANELAIQSAQLASQAEYATWKVRSAQLIQDLKGTKEELEYHLAPVKTPDLYHEVLVNLAEAQVKQIDQDYKASFDHADKAREAKEKIWASMRDRLNQTLAEIKQAADWLGENTLEPKGRDLKVKMLEPVPDLEQKIALRDWRAAHAAAEKCLDTAQKTMDKLKDQNRAVMARQLQNTLAEYKKSNVLAILPEKQEQFQKTLRSLSRSEPDVTYAEAYQQFQESSQAVENLPKTIVAEANVQIEEIANILRQADEAGALKYYKDWYRQQSSNLQLLRNAVRGENHEEIAKYMKILEKEAPKLLLATQKAAAEDQYLTNLQSNLNQMNNVFQDFGFLGSMSKNIIIAARLTEHQLEKTVKDMYLALQGTMTVSTFRINAELLEEAVKGMTPPDTMKNIHNKAIQSFVAFRKAAEGFEIYGQSDAYDLYFREKSLAQSYEYLQKALRINKSLMFEITQARKMPVWEKVLWKIGQLEESASNFYFDWGY